MRSSVWAALLRHIPPEQHNQLMVVTTGGIEITIASLLRIEEEFIAIKGRLSGTQDTGRVFFMPFANIDYVGFQKPLKDSEFEELFSNLVLPRAAPEAPAPAVAPSEALSVPAVEEAPVPASDEPDKPASAPRLPIESAVLERFRSRGSTFAPPPVE